MRKNHIACAAAIVLAAAAARGANEFRPGLPAAWDGTTPDATFRTLPFNQRPQVAGLGIQPAKFPDGVRQIGGFSLKLALTANDFAVFYRQELPMGKVEPLDAKRFEDIEIESEDWTHHTYSINDGLLRITVSRLTPAILADCDGDNLGLFKDWTVQYRMFAPGSSYGGVYTYLAFGMRLKKMYGLAHPDTWMKNEIFTYTPRFGYAAYATDEGIAVLGSGPESVVSADEIQGEMTENWCLLWFSEYTPIGRGHRQVTSEDLPFLLVFENRPKKLHFSYDGIDVSRPGGVGKVAFMPLLGMRMPSVEDETSKWAGDVMNPKIPEHVIAACRWWSKRLAMYPVSVTESFRFDPDSGDATIRNEFSYLEMDGDFMPEEETPAQYAPFPPMLANASDFFGLEGNDPGYFDIPGRYIVADNTNAIEYTIRSAGKYVFERPVFAPQALPGALKQKLVDETKRILAAGRLAPLHLGHQHVPKGAASSNPWPYVPTAYYAPFSNPAELPAMLALSLEFLDASDRPAALELISEELKEYPPLDTPYLPFLEGARRENYEIIPYEREFRIKPELERHAQAQSELGRISHPYLCMTLYNLAVCADKTGDLSYIGENWDRIDEMFRGLAAESDWPRMGLFHQREGEAIDGLAPVAAAGGVSTANRLIAGAVGYARIAAMLKKEAASQWGCYLAAKWLAARKGLECYVDVMSGRNGGEVTGVKGATHGRADILRPAWFDEYEALLRSNYVSHNTPLEAFSVHCLTPEAARYLHDTCLDEAARYAKEFEYIHPVWFAARAPRQFPGETTLERPDMKRDMFMFDAMVLGRDEETLMDRLDIPFCPLGDLDYMRNIMLISWAAAGRQWAPRR